jgi:hypothetical protein
MIRITVTICILLLMLIESITKGLMNFSKVPEAYYLKISTSEIKTKAYNDA